jgi:hypothetical protein
MKWMMRVYDFLLRLYPARYRHEFANEMHAVFAQAMNETHKSKRLYLCLIELRDLPVAIIRAHRAN